MQGAWKVGLLVVVFGGLFIGAMVFLGKVFGRADVVVYKASMPDAGGVTPGAKLLMAGVQVGAVKSVALESPTQARLQLEVDARVKIPKGSSLRLPTSMLSLGENPITIVAGPGPGYMDPDVDELTGTRETILETSLPEVKVALGELQELTASLKVVLEKMASDERLAKIDGLIDQFKETAKSYSALGQRVDNLLASSSGDITGAIGDLRSAMASAKDASELVSRSIKDGKYNEKIEGIVSNLNKTTEEAGKLLTDIRGFVNDPKLRTSLDRTMENMEAMTDSGTRIAADTEQIAKNGVQISEKVNTFTDKANELADSAKDALEKLKQLVGKAPSVNKLNIAANLDLMHESRPNRYRTDLEVSFSLGENRVYAGLFDAFETNRITLQVGQKVMPRTELRYGIYASKPGLGVEYEIARGFALRADVFDINNPRADLRARFDLGGGFYGWLGAQQLFKRNSLMVGVGFRRK